MISINEFQWTIWSREETPLSGKKYEQNQMHTTFPSLDSHPFTFDTLSTLSDRNASRKFIKEKIVRHERIYAPSSSDVRRQGRSIRNREILLPERRDSAYRRGRWADEVA